MDYTKFFIFVVGSLVVFLLYFYYNGRVTRKQRIRRLEEEAKLTNNELGYSSDLESPVELDNQPSGFASFCKRFMELVGIDVDSAIKDSKKQLALAGINDVNSPITILFYRRIISIFIILGGVALLLHPELAVKISGITILVIGLFGGNLYIKNRILKRQKELLRSFPDGLDLMVVCVESGLALDAAVSRVCTELASAHPELARELNRTRLELALLNNRAQALSNLSERTDLVAYRSFVAALIQTERFGTNLTDTLRVLSDDYRQTRLMLAEEKAGRLPALITIPLMLLLMPALFIIILGAPFIQVAGSGFFASNR